VKGWVILRSKYELKVCDSNVDGNEFGSPEIYSQELKFNTSWESELSIVTPKISNKCKTSATILDCNIDLTSDLRLFFQHKARFGTWLLENLTRLVPLCST